LPRRDDLRPVVNAMTNTALPPYAELHCLSNFSFLRGASHPEELVEQAHALGYAGLALTDECSLAGAVRAHEALGKLRETAGHTNEAGDFRLIFGAEFRLEDGLKLVLLARNRAGYGNLSALITLARRRAGKGSYRLLRGDLEAISPGGAVPDCLALWVPSAEATTEDGRWLAERFPGRLWVAVELLCGPDDAGELARLHGLAAAAGLPLVAAGDVHMHARARRPLQDTLTAIRLSTTVFEAGASIPTASATCARPCAWPASTRPNCWPNRRASPPCATFRWPSCATNIPRKWCRPARRRRVTCGARWRRAWPGATPAACQPRSRPEWARNWP